MFQMHAFIHRIGPKLDSLNIEIHIQIISIEGIRLSLPNSLVICQY